MQLYRTCLLVWTTGLLLHAAEGPAADAFRLNDLGIAADNQGHYVEAEQFYRQSLDIWRGLGPSYQPHFATTLYNLGEVECNLGRWNVAAKEFGDALEISRRTLGPKHLRTISVMNALANSSMVLGDFERAEALADEALAVERELYPGTDLLSHTLIVKAALLDQTGHSPEALAPADEALSVALVASGENSAATALAYTEAGMVRRSNGQPERALPLLRKASAIYQRVLGADHPMTASAASQEGLALMDLGQMGLAERQLTSAIATVSHCASCAYELAIAKTNLGSLRLRQRKYAKADAVLSEALVLEQQTGSPAHGGIGTTLRLLAQAREQEHRTADAEQLRREAAGFLPADVRRK
jgi:tetratricopeptide (TPR) repeat protein